MEKHIFSIINFFCSSSYFHDIRVWKKMHSLNEGIKKSEKIYKEYLKAVVVWPIVKQNRDGQEKSEVMDNVSDIENSRYFSHWFLLSHHIRSM